MKIGKEFQKKISVNGKRRKRIFLHCKRCNLLFRLDNKSDIENRNRFHFCSKARQLSLMDSAKPSIEYAHYNFAAEGHLFMSQATSDSFTFANLFNACFSGRAIVVSNG